MHDSPNKGIYRGRGYKGGNYARGSMINGGRGQSWRGYISKICSYCNIFGQTIDVCYIKHGFPLIIRNLVM
ncbi:hypothetical protein Lalb_Chr25g0281301 [Lupinus albus]|uniref:Uncharacterized protein n=1 Tax=Lupinus albus TaxID=3870 RepID=A0A6A4NBA2_LUPAL|nr:hypothetical protein Lalb_Chr25g0281301 [Lupinus albus]